LRGKIAVCTAVCLLPDNALACLHVVCGCRCLGFLARRSCSNKRATLNRSRHANVRNSAAVVSLPFDFADGSDSSLLTARRCACAWESLRLRETWDTFASLLAWQEWTHDGGSCMVREYFTGFVLTCKWVTGMPAEISLPLMSLHAHSIYMRCFSCVRIAQPNENSS
jgi:hypothetical protein